MQKWKTETSSVQAYWCFGAGFRCGRGVHGPVARDSGACHYSRRSSSLIPSSPVRPFRESSLGATGLPHPV
eukprot:697640-Amphidinium_carterae.1